VCSSDLEVLATEPECTDIAVMNAGKEPDDILYEGDNALIYATVKRAHDGPAGPVTVTLTATGPGGYKKTTSFSLNQGQSRKVSWWVETVTANGTYTFNATPADVRDCAPGNNKATVTLKVTELPDLEDLESDIWAESGYSS
jgi:hypothetical protein